MTGTRGIADGLPPDLLQEAAGTFGLLASTMRLHIVWVLSQGECDVGGLAEQVGGTLPTVSQHLAKLKLAGLVRARRQGRHQVYVVEDPNLAAMVRLMVEHLAALHPDAGTRRALGA
ncbi:DNA-binding transcriptional ArsR family regulator [Streptacidiphilus sp. MAP12-16]|uniref:ArsR/SmtB family transcription factor n=1 Tax=Streptacidiphilus sp. MAP12-16 TaxID=3156300 RepID=UPI003511D949